jgi:hypothetical protein
MAPTRTVVERLHGDAGEHGASAQRRRVGEEEAAAAVVQQPLPLHLVLERAVHQPVGAQVVALRVVHRHQQVLRLGAGAEHGEGERRAEPRDA